MILDYKSFQANHNIIRQDMKQCVAGFLPLFPAQTGKVPNARSHSFSGNQKHSSPPRISSRFMSCQAHRLQIPSSLLQFNSFIKLALNQDISQCHSQAVSVLQMTGGEVVSSHVSRHVPLCAKCVPWSILGPGDAPSLRPHQKLNNIAKVPLFCQGL